MPTYEYRCEKCRMEFNKVQSIAERDRGGLRCPGCGSEQVYQRVSQFTAQTSRKS